jgi:hypothetical protein
MYGCQIGSIYHMCLAAFRVTAFNKIFLGCQLHRWIKSTRVLETDSTSFIKVLCGENIHTPKAHVQPQALTLCGYKMWEDWGGGGGSCVRMRGEREAVCESLIK